MRPLAYLVLVPLCLVVLAVVAFGQTPPAPINLKAQVSPQMPPGIDLKWQLPPVMPPIPPTVFKIFRSVDDSVNFKLLNVTTMPWYNDRQVFPGHTYFYYCTAVWVHADSTFHESGKSNLAWASLLPPPGGTTGEIAGTVTDSISGKPIPYARILFFRPVSPVLWVPQTWADSLGHYRAVVDTGTYLVNCQPPAWMIMSMSPLPPYKPEWYKDAATPAQATPVAVKEGSSTTINFDLVRFSPPPIAHIRGTVRDSIGTPLKGALVVIARTIQEMEITAGMNDEITVMPGEVVDVDGLGCLRGIVWKGFTDSTGKFDAPVLADRAYTAMAEKMGYIPQYFDHKNNPLEATLIKVSSDVNNIDFNLNPFRPPHMYSISGVVKDSNGVRVPSRIVLFPLRPRPMNVAVRFGHTDSLGAYTLPRVPAGKYLVLAVPFGGYAPAFYKEGQYGVFRWKQADTVVVAGDVKAIDIGVVKIHCVGIARLSGVVRSGGQAVEGANVLARTTDGTVVGYGLTENTGAYTIEGLSAGAITMVVDREGFEPAEQRLTIGASDYNVTQDFTLGATTSAIEQAMVPSAFFLGQNYPNPFNPSTRIGIALPVAAHLTVKVFNLLGQEVALLANGYYQAGNHEIAWTGRDAAGNGVASGVYFYRLDASAVDGGPVFSAMKKMILLK